MEDLIELFEVDKGHKIEEIPNPIISEQQGALNGKEIMDIDIMFKGMPR